MERVHGPGNKVGLHSQHALVAALRREPVLWESRLHHQER